MVDFGDILSAVGDFGLFQKLLLLGLCTPCVLLPMTFTNLLFLQSDPVRRCNTDWILRAHPSLTPEEQANLTLPRGTDGTFSRCEMFVPVDWDIDAIREYGLNETTECQNGWLYDKSMYEATIVTDFDLVCSRSNLAEVAQTVFMAGLLAGTFIFGPVAESYGRRRATQIPVALFLIFTITAGLSPGLYTYMTSQFIVGAAAAAYRVNAPILATEWIGVSRRSLASCLSQMCAAVGGCLMSGLVYAVRDWRMVQYAMAGPMAAVFMYIWFIPESARWLLSQGRRAESKVLLLKVAEINGTPVPETLLAEVTEEPKKQSGAGGIKLLFTSPVLIKRVVIISFVWASLSLGYFCLSLNVGKLGLNIFVVQFLFGVTEIPAQLLCIWFLELFGRRISLTSTLLTGGLFCLLALAFPQDSAITITALATVGRFFLSWAGSVSMLYSQELFPTSLRQTAVALASIGYRIAGLLSPSLNLLALYHWAVPTSVFGSLAIISGAVAFLLPETRRTELPDSTDEPVGKRNITSVKNGTPDVSNLNSITSTKL